MSIKHMTPDPLAFLSFLYIFWRFISENKYSRTYRGARVMC